jgi:hypothetical protein
MIHPFPTKQIVTRTQNTTATDLNSLLTTFQLAILPIIGKFGILSMNKLKSGGHVVTGAMANIKASLKLVVLSSTNGVVSQSSYLITVTSSNVELSRKNPSNPLDTILILQMLTQKLTKYINVSLVFSGSD